MSPRLFGTDGIRGAFGEPPLVRSTVTALGFRLGEQLADDHGRAPTVVLGGDTRGSTPDLCRWLASGLVAAGAEVRYGGVLPTPAVAHLTRTSGADTGVAVSASHNPAPDNGIKLIDGDGFKWSRQAEARLEARLAQPLEHEPPSVDIDEDREMAAHYLDALAGCLPGDRPLKGLRLALDTSNGAASAFAGDLFARLGVDATVCHASPDGTNINDGCGSTVPEALAARVATGDFDLGFTFDGDADRAILIDEAGEIRDGDAMLYLWARHLAAAGALVPPTIVVTSMSNLGLERALARDGIGLVRCGVGDRQVVETLKTNGLQLGGEQSGHIVHLGLSSTGDGLLTALQLAHVVATSGLPASRLLEGFRRYPQILLNVRVRSKPDLDSVPSIHAAAQHVHQDLGADGRLVLRYSGTEPLARVMIEGPDQPQVDRLAHHLATVIRTELA